MELEMIDAVHLFRKVDHLQSHISELSDEHLDYRADGSLVNKLSVFGQSTAGKNAHHQFSESTQKKVFVYERDNDSYNELTEAKNEEEDPETYHERASANLKDFDLVEFQIGGEGEDSMKYLTDDVNEDALESAGLQLGEQTPQQEQREDANLVTYSLPSHPNTHAHLASTFTCEGEGREAFIPLQRV